MPPSSRAGMRLLLLASTQFLIALDYNIVYVALPDIGDALGFSAQSLQWVVSAYAVGFGGLLLLGGRTVDRLGARRMLVAGLALFGLACLVGGLANDAGLLVGARAVQGIGGALVTPATLALINGGFREGPERIRALSVWGAAGCGGLAVGALAGGVLTQAASWRWVLLVMVPLALGMALAGPAVLDADQRGDRPRGGFDVTGAVVATAGSTLLVFGLVSGPDKGWLTVQAAGAIAAGAVLLATFVLVEHRAGNPLAPLRMFGNRSLVTAMLVTFVTQSSLGGGYYLFTTYLQVGRGYDALDTGLMFLPLTVLSVFGALYIGPKLIGMWGMRAALGAGMAVTGAGITALGVGLVTSGSLWAVAPGIVVWGLAGGATFPVLFIVAASGVPAEEAGVASSLATTSQQVGGAAGLAVLIAIANAGLDFGGGAPPSAAAIIHGLRVACVVAGLATVAGAFLAFVLKRQPVAVAAQESVLEKEIVA